MSEYIKKTSIIGLAHKLRFGRILTDREVEVIEMAVKDVPAADVAPVRHGRWIDSKEDGHPSICGVCNYPVDRFYKTKYCPNCGAKMDGGAEDAADN